MAAEVLKEKMSGKSLDTTLKTTISIGIKPNSTYNYYSGVQ